MPSCLGSTTQNRQHSWTKLSSLQGIHASGYCMAGKPVSEGPFRFSQTQRALTGQGGLEPLNLKQVAPETSQPMLLRSPAAEFAANTAAQGGGVPHQISESSDKSVGLLSGSTHREGRTRCSHNPG